jgi:hypothetical protein
MAPSAMSLIVLTVVGAGMATLVSSRSTAASGTVVWRRVEAGTARS